MALFAAKIFKQEGEAAAHELNNLIVDAKDLGLMDERLKLHTSAHEFLVTARAM